jgi:hypothetical protein
MYLSGHQYSYPDVLRGHRLVLFLPLPVGNGKHPLGGSDYLGGLEGRAEGGAVGVGLVIDKGHFWSSFPCLYCGLQRMASI